MFKNKTIKLFLMLGVILFSLVGIVGCSNQTVNATYIKMSYQKDVVYGQFNIVNNHHDLVALLKDDSPEKYNDAFFETKSLLATEIVEASTGSRSEIETYKIKAKTLTVYVKTKQFGVDCVMAYWWYLLELSKDEVNKIDSIKIFKDDKEIMNDSISQNYYQSYSFSNVTNWPSFIGEEYNLLIGERRYQFIMSFSELKNTFEASITNDVITNYFSENLFDENIVLCVVRDETSGTADVKYYDFKVDGLELSIKEKIVGGGAEVVSRYLDFVIIPKNEIPNGNLDAAIGYYWN